MTAISGKTVFNLVLLGMGLFLLTQAYQLPTPSVANISPAFFPKAIGWIFVALMVAIGIQDFLKERRARAIERAPLNGVRLLCLGVVFLTLLGYVVLVEQWGYAITTAVFLLVCSLALSVFFAKADGKGRKLDLKEVTKAVAFAVITTAVLYAVFGMVFSIVLP